MATDMTFSEVIEKIQAADMVLVGLGEAFDDISFLKKDEVYRNGRNVLEESGQLWLLPAYDEWHRGRFPERKALLEDALRTLAVALDGKNYFVVSTSVNDMLEDISWREGRLVRPCGGGRKKQCADNCGGDVLDLMQDDRKTIAEYFERLEKRMSDISADLENNHESNPGIEALQLDLQECPQCGRPYILNNIFAEKYDEAGYLSQWQLYTKWLQGTLNKKLVILELGVGMKFPSVIRWPFEKVAFFNQKAEFYRVDANLYQMSEELKEKGVSIAKNAIDWLRGM